MRCDQSAYRERSTQVEQSGDSTASAVVLLVLGVVAVVGYLVVGYFIGRVLRKAGDPLWYGFVPLLNTWRLFELGGFGGWWSILSFVPLVNIAAGVILLIAQYRIGLGFAKDGAFVLLAIFLPIVWFIWIGLDSSWWDPARAVPAVARY